MSKYYSTDLLKSGLAISSSEDGEIQIYSQITDKLVLATSAAELAYILQLFQDHWGGIPVKIDPSDFKGLVGS